MLQGNSRQEDLEAMQRMLIDQQPVHVFFQLTKHLSIYDAYVVSTLIIYDEVVMLRSNINMS